MTFVEPLLISSFTGTNCLGAGNRAIFAALDGRRSGLRPCDFEDAVLKTWIGRVDGLEDELIAGTLADYDCRNNRLAQLALSQDSFVDAVAAARERYNPRRIAVLLGTSTSGIHQTELAYQRRDASGALPPDLRYAETHNNFSLADFVRRRLDLAGPAHVVSTACSSSAKAFASAARMIAAGLCDAVVVGGVDSLCLTTLYGFSSLELTSRGPCRPFDARRDGLSLGEGAGFALLEKIHSATAPDDLLFLGAGESADAYHMSTPHPDGVGAFLAMERALAAAGLDPADIDYINCHGTASRANDAAEDKAVSGLFGAAVSASSTKGWTGHTLGAAGITEAIICLLCIRHGLIPGCLNTEYADQTFGSRIEVGNQTRTLGRVLSNSFGFGGSNCSLVFGRAGG